ncbi:MAG: hypothetical protein ABR987_07115 [Terracidiphilus sp.]
MLRLRMIVTAPEWLSARESLTSNSDDLAVTCEPNQMIRSRSHTTLGRQAPETDNMVEGL